jgi:chromosomal replication initiation ATPase DnaA
MKAITYIGIEPSEKIDFLKEMKDKMNSKFKHISEDQVNNSFSRESKLNRLLYLTAEFFGVEMDLILNSKQKKEIVKIRNYYMYAARTYTSDTLVDIGKSVTKHHSTVLNAIRIVVSNAETYIEDKDELDRFNKFIIHNKDK